MGLATGFTSIAATSVLSPNPSRKSECNQACAHVRNTKGEHVLIASVEWLEPRLLLIPFPDLQTLLPYTHWDLREFPSWSLILL